VKDGERRERVCYKLITPSNIIYNSIIFNILHFLDSGFTGLYLLHLFQGLKCLTSIIFNILHFLDSGFTRLYLLHLFQGLKCLTLPIIETYTLACRILKFLNLISINNQISLIFLLFLISYIIIIIIRATGPTQKQQKSKVECSFQCPYITYTLYFG
jgi:hypothetical protein